MKQTFVFISILLLGAMPLVAQETEKAKEETKAWTKGGVFSLNYSQIALSNWAAGGENSMTGVGFFSAFANYSEGKTSWDNTLEMGFGVLKQDDEAWYKSEDKLQFSSKYGHKTNSDWYHSALMDFKSQFTKGYAENGDTKHSSNFFAPAYLNLAIGMDYKPSDNFTVMLSPVSGKFTFVTDSSLSNYGAYGVDAGEQFRAEFGAFVKVAYKTEIMKNISYETTLDLFSNYFHNPLNVDVNWDNMLNFKINEYFTATLMLNMVYDDDITFDIEDENNDVIKSVPQLQLKEMFAIGFSYKF